MKIPHHQEKRDMDSQYDRKEVESMWRELEQIGVQPLTTADEVDRFMANGKGTSMIVINSVCGCAAGSLRPGLAMALQNDRIPDRMATVFAGVDTEATERVREILGGVKPSSPMVAIFRNSALAYVMERHMIEGRSSGDIVTQLRKRFDQYCSRPGPSVPWDTVLKTFSNQRV